MEKIALRNFSDPVKIEAETKAIERATQHTEQVLTEYANRPETFGGRYVCADSFKELMPGFAQSRESRSALNGAVHNAAAVLSSEQFRRLVDRGPEPGRDEVVFVTGIPGAGKSSSVANSFRNSSAVVFEGQMSRPEPTMQKIDQALQKGFKVGIVAVHVAPELALERTNFRYNDPNNGRGASLNVMADIQGNLADGMRQIERKYGNLVSLVVLDNNPDQKQRHDGWQSIHILEKEGNRDNIYERLSRALDAGYREGRYSAGFYVQAAGREPPVLDTGIRQQDDRGIQAYGDGSGVPEIYSKYDALNAERAQAFRKETPEKAIQQHPELAPAYGFVRACEAKAETDGLSEEQRTIVMARVRENIARRIERGDVPSVQIREERQVKTEQQHDPER